jgi:uncharacterized membrane protein YbhN (UPF0104 family)
VLTVFLDRLLGLCVLLCISCGAVLLNFSRVREEPLLTSMAVFVWLLLGLVLVAGVLFYNDWIRSIRWLRWLSSKLPFQSLLTSLSGATYVYKFHRRHVLEAVLISAAIHILVTLMNGVLLLCLVSDLPPPLVLFLLIPFAQIIMAIPISPGSWGTSEAAYFELLALAGIQVGALIAILQRLAYYFWGLVGCVYYLSHKRKFRKEKEIDEPKEVEDESPVSGRPRVQRAG